MLSEGVIGFDEPDDFLLKVQITKIGQQCESGHFDGSAPGLRNRRSDHSLKFFLEWACTGLSIQHFIDGSLGSVSAMYPVVRLVQA